MNVKSFSTIDYRSLLSVFFRRKSFVAVNLGTVLAQTNKKVLLVDADLRKPTLHTILNLENEEGLTSLQLEDSLDADEVIQFASTFNLHFFRLDRYLLIRLSY